MISRLARPAATAVLVLAPAAGGAPCAAALTAVAPGPPGGAWEVLSEHTRPTPAQLAEAIQVWDPHGYVTSLATQASRAGETVVSLDSDILFAFGSADMPSAAGAAITDLVAAVPAGAVVQVVGHTDAIGSDADNEVLSQDRAAAVAAAVASTRPDLVLEVSGRGESEPVASNRDPEGREQNRRVEIRYAG